MKIKIRFITVAILTLCMAAATLQLNIITYADTSHGLSDGTYTIQGFMKSATSEQASMGNGAITQPMKLIVNGDQLILRLECKALTTSLGTSQFTGYLASLNFFPSWEGGASGVASPQSETPQTLNIESYYDDIYDSYNHPTKGTDQNVKGKLYPKVIDLPVSYKDDEIWVQVYVPVMEGISAGSGLQYARLQLSWDTLEKINDQVPELPSVGKTQVINQSGSQTTETTTSSQATTTTKTKKKKTKLDRNHLANGIYSVTGAVYKTDKKTKSMANEAINHKIQLTVKKGKYYISLDFQGIKINQQFGYLSKLKYFQSGYQVNSYGVPTGSVKSVTINSYQEDTSGNKIKDSFGTNYPNKVTFPLIKEAVKNSYVPLQGFVPIMDAISRGSGTQAMYLKLDWKTLKKVSSANVFQNNQNSGTSSNTTSARANSTIGSSSLTAKQSLGGNSLTSGSSTQALSANEENLNTGTNQEEKKETTSSAASSPAAIPSVMSVFAAALGMLYKVKSRGIL